MNKKCIEYRKKIKCKNCIFAKFEHSYNKFGMYNPNSWGGYCSRQGDHYSKNIYDKFTGEFSRVRKKLTRLANRVGNCSFYIKKWYKFWIK